MSGDPRDRAHPRPWTGATLPQSLPPCLEGPTGGCPPTPTLESLWQPSSGPVSAGSPLTFSSPVATLKTSSTTQPTARRAAPDECTSFHMVSLSTCGDKGPAVRRVSACHPCPPTLVGAVQLGACGVWGLSLQNPSTGLLASLLLIIGHTQLTFGLTFFFLRYARKYRTGKEP